MYVHENLEQKQWDFSITFFIFTLVLDLIVINP